MDPKPEILKEPDTVKNISVRKDSDIKIWLNNVVELAIFLIPEKCIWHPYLEWEHDLSEISFIYVF